MLLTSYIARSIQQRRCSLVREIQRTRLRVRHFDRLARAGAPLVEYCARLESVKSANSV